MDHADAAEDLIEKAGLKDDIEEMFYDPVGFLPPSSSRDSVRYSPAQDKDEEEKIPYSQSENQEPLERDVLPYFKDPKLKISIWTIIKDSIGKDISKMSVPVYFNDPMNILQKCASSMEYCTLLD